MRAAGEDVLPVARVEVDAEREAHAAGEEDAGAEAGAWWAGGGRKVAPQASVPASLMAPKKPKYPKAKPIKEPALSGGYTSPSTRSKRLCSGPPCCARACGPLGIDSCSTSDPASPRKVLRRPSRSRQRYWR